MEGIFGIKLQDTRVYREAKEEGRQEGIQQVREESRRKVRLELIPKLLARGMSVEEVAELLGLTEEQVTQASINPKFIS